ncbi:MAG: hypothetical protein NC408_04575 [Candidatus Gastranaerophilales bacterium]|nr:hypothetical protein [Candidatus Gastranaerophilales bacterium]MCM1072253.1 hypothetical protein [Bacteroides sp.]
MNIFKKIWDEVNEPTPLAKAIQEAQEEIRKERLEALKMIENEQDKTKLLQIIAKYTYLSYRD